MNEKEKPDEYIIGNNGEEIGICWPEYDPRKLLKRVIDLEDRLERLEEILHLVLSQTKKDLC